MLYGLFPPGYSPSHPYVYAVRNSPITLRCNELTYEPRQNALQIELLLSRLGRFFNHRAGRDQPVFPGKVTGWEWYEPEPIGGRPFAALEVEVPDISPRELKAEDFWNALKGVDDIRLAWPKLDVRCEILKNVEGKGVLGVGWVYLFYEPGMLGGGKGARQFV
ncbi:MAG: hypothetical protein Q9169_004404 [Polycauliona sp. 2 TL-2023]